MRNDQRYAAINDGRTYPPLTREQAGKVTKALLRHFGSPEDAAMRPTYALRLDQSGRFDEGTRKATRAELAHIWRRYTDRHPSGARRCWVSASPSTGHAKGWGRLIHDVSHMLHEYRHPKERPHGHLHAGIEQAVQAYVEAQGWLQPQPKPVAASVSDRRAARLMRLETRLVRWECKARRAVTAIRKLKRQITATRAHADLTCAV